MDEFAKLTETLARVYEVKPAEMRRRDMAPDDQRIAEAEAEREAAVAEVVAEHPYPEEA